MCGEWAVSIRRACRVFLFDTSTYHYASRRSGQADLKLRIKEIAETRVCYGYRQIHVLLRREGWKVNAKRIWWLYCELGLQLRNKTPKRRVKAKLREDRGAATTPNQIWAMDFVHDQRFDGKNIRALTIVDTFSRMSLGIDVRQSYRGMDVAETLERTAYSAALSSFSMCYGPEFISKKLDLWAFMKGVGIAGQPTA